MTLAPLMMIQRGGFGARRHLHHQVTIQFQQPWVPVDGGTAVSPASVVLSKLAFYRLALCWKPIVVLLQTSHQ
jgi:hypothetical protein